MTGALKKLKKAFLDMDKTLLFVSFILILFGTLNIVTASSREAVINNDTNLYFYFFKHSAILIVSFVFFLTIVLSIRTKDYRKVVPLLFIIIFVLNLFLILNGASKRGARLWIDLGFFNLQPGEFAKPILIITMALLFELNYKKLKSPNQKHDIVIWKILGCGLIFPILVFCQKDLGTATILFTVFIVLYLSSPISLKEKIKSLLIVGVIGVIGIFIIYSVTGYVLSNAQKARLDFFDPCSKYSTSGYQVCNAFIAINSGGITGVGLGKSTQKYSYIPEPHTDMVFAIISEENGFIKCSLIFVAYIIILFKILKLSMKTANIRNKYICLGVATYIFSHIFVNLGGLFGIIPVTGVPLPFLSYGGSFTISLIGSLGIIQKIHIETKNQKIKI